MGCFSVVPTLVLGIFVFRAELFTTLFLACLQVVLLTPVLLRYSRLLWIHWDFRADPK